MIKRFIMAAVLVAGLLTIGVSAAQAHGTCQGKATITSGSGGATAKFVMDCGRYIHNYMDATVNLVRASNNNVIATGFNSCSNCGPSVTATASSACIVGQKYFASGVGTASGSGNHVKSDTSPKVTCISQP